MQKLGCLDAPAGAVQHTLLYSAASVHHIHYSPCSCSLVFSSCISAFFALTPLTRHHLRAATPDCTHDSGAPTPPHLPFPTHFTRVTLHYWFPVYLRCPATAAALVFAPVGCGCVRWFCGRPFCSAVCRAYAYPRCVPGVCVTSRACHGAAHSLLPPTPVGACVARLQRVLLLPLPERTQHCTRVGRDMNDVFAVDMTFGTPTFRFLHVYLFPRACHLPTPPHLTILVGRRCAAVYLPTAFCARHAAQRFGLRADRHALRHFCHLPVYPVHATYLPRACGGARKAFSVVVTLRMAIKRCAAAGRQRYYYLTTFVLDALVAPLFLFLDARRGAACHSVFLHTRARAFCRPPAQRQFYLTAGYLCCPTTDHHYSVALRCLPSTTPLCLRLPRTFVNYHPTDRYRFPSSHLYLGRFVFARV